MKRTVILRPAGVHQITSPSTIDPGTSPYANSNTPSLTLAEAWADELNTSYHYVEDADKGIVTFETPPTLCTFAKVTLSTKWDYSQAGPNNWWFPPDVTNAPRIRILLIGRDGSSEHAGAWYEIDDTPGDPTNVNINIWGPAYFPGLHEQTWELTSHPDGGPFTFDDLLNLKAGIECAMDDGPNGKPFDPSQGGFYKLRVPIFRATLEVEDLGGFVSNIRHSTALSLRWFRRARNAFRPVTLIQHSVGDVGSRVWLSHPRGPAFGSVGWGQRRLERRAGLVLKRRIYPESLRIEDEVFDLRAFACLAWASYRIGGAWSPELQGVALLDKGGGWTHARDQDAWSIRPGDGRAMRVLEDYPNVSSEGLAAQGGGDESVCLRNWDLTETGWSATGAESGEFTIAQDATVAMVEEAGYQSAAKLTFGSGGGTGGRTRSLGTLPYNSGDFIHVDVIVRNSSVPTPGTQFLQWSLSRSGGGLAAPEWWDEANRQWTTSSTYNPIPSDEPFGRVRADAIPCDAAGASSDPSYGISVGRFSSSIAGCEFHGALVDVQHSDDQVAGARTPTVVLDSPITRTADVHSLPNSTAAQLWSYDRGVAFVEFAPAWDSASLPAGAVKPLLHCQHATDTWDALQFVAPDGGAAVVRFERGVSGQSTFQLDVEIPNTDSLWAVARGHVVRAWARWLGADGWDEFAPYSVEVGVVVLDEDGAIVETGSPSVQAIASAVGALSYTGAVTARDTLFVGSDPTPRYLDAIVRAWETRLNPLHGIECLWRL